jgi:hypothetical protein
MTALVLDAGALLGKAGTSDPSDATVALLAGTGVRILTSAVTDIERLLAATGKRATVVPV